MEWSAEIVSKQRIVVEAESWEKAYVVAEDLAAKMNVTLEDEVQEGALFQAIWVEYHN